MRENHDTVSNKKNKLTKQLRKTVELINKLFLPFIKDIDQVFNKVIITGFLDIIEHNT